MLSILTPFLLAAPLWVRNLVDWIARKFSWQRPDPFWADYVVWPIIQIAIVLFVILTVVAYLVYLERKVSAFMQARLGPMRVGPWGLLQPAADGLKLLLKEDIIPLKADKAVFAIAPIIAVVSSLLVLSVVPWGAAWATISNINIGLLFILSVSSVSVLGLVLAGWSSNSKYSLLGALRSSAQMVSYEVAMGLSIIGALMFAKTLSMTGIVEAQRADGIWYVFFQPLGFLVYLISALGETNRAPFDLPEAESELVAGYHTEYSGFRWALFFMAEYTAMIVTSAVAVTLFLGGWYFPGLGLIKNQTAFVLVSVLVFAAKVFVLIYAYMWFRWTWPRYRYDQLMELGWKWMIPAGLANIVLTGIWYVLALPKARGGVFDNLMTTVRERLVPTGSGKAYFIVTGFLITIPIVWALLAAINRRSRDFNLHEQRQLQVKLRRERIESRAEPQPAAE
ncbi:MAG TPA: NADH-quinone oxidoreductase subunit NuoH [Blastocatellia bacterium]|jgi:NADH-quinone oxidoreductase subunit H|nr:NADH-quinone oxidoreductase subunit NuoH [Blastocatellia bacterium]